jgi:dinuclear metal center YbgI/SA1388 family protein
MLVKDLIKHIESWAPPGVAWERDNVGLQVGSTDAKVKNIFLALELSENSLKQAIDKKCNFIFTHHPFIFKPLKKIDTTSDQKSKIIAELLKNSITLYSAHTNLDFTKDGVSFILARTLNLNNVRLLEHSKGNQKKLVVFIPEKHLNEVADALFEAGAGRIGEYNNCSYSSSGIGTFQGSEESTPYLGKKERFESVEEKRLEVLVPDWKLNGVIKALLAVHPYDEPAYDIYPVENKNLSFGYGAIGELTESMNENEFLSHVCNSLKINDLRYCKGARKRIKKVAVCGGSGTELLSNAIAADADAFITADIKYHPFQDAEHKIFFVDAGHYETEVPVLNEVKKKFEKKIKAADAKIKVFKYSGSTNPVKFFNNSRSK